MDLDVGCWSDELMLLFDPAILAEQLQLILESIIYPFRLGELWPCVGQQPCTAHTGRHRKPAKWVNLLWVRSNCADAREFTHDLPIGGR